MYQRKTVFVIGAGCSYEFGLPLGWKLRDDIYGGLKSRKNAIEMAFLQSPATGGTRGVVQLMEMFANGVHTKASIDQYLHFHRHDEEFVMLGKCAIAWAILDAESKSHLKRGQLERGFGTIPDNWLMRLFHGMNDSTELASVANLFNNVSFICFNYDRCIEVAFFNAILKLTNGSIEDAASVMQHLRIWHPYGTVGEIDYHDASPRRPLLGFPELEPEWFDVRSGALRLRTFTEGMDDEGKLAEMRQALHDAQRIVYLGFSFLDQNMELLTAGSPDPDSRLFATCTGLSGPDQQLAMQAIARAAALPGGDQSWRLNHVTLHNSTAVEFFGHWGNTLRR